MDIIELVKKANRGGIMHQFCKRFMFNILIFTLVFIGFSESLVDASVVSQRDFELDEYLIQNGLQEKDVVEMSPEFKELIYNDFKKELEKDPNAKIYFERESSTDYYINDAGLLEEVPTRSLNDGGFVIQSETIPATQLALSFSRVWTSNSNVWRIFADFEWKINSTAPREFLGFAKETNIDIIPDSYACSIQRRYTTSESWAYYGNCGGRPYRIDSNNGATWNWSGNAAFYKGYVSYQIRKPSNVTKAIFQMEYASVPKNKSTTVNASFGNISISHTIGGGERILLAPKRSTVTLQ